MPTDIIIRNCAPTLAGLKAGNLFAYRCSPAESLDDVLEEQNRLLNPKGVYFLLVRRSQDSALFYVYRRKRLEAILAQPDTQDFLCRFGYTDFTVEACLCRLCERLQQKDFPHDIGVFLDYPLADIQAFIRNKGANCPCVGCWKAYTNVPEAERKFASFKKCTRVYCQRFTQGADISRLTVAG